MKMKPLKPNRPTRHLVIPPSGLPYACVEELPRDKEELEFVIGTKFLGTLIKMGESYHDLCKAPEEASYTDLTCKDVHGNQVDIQVTEIVDNYKLSLQIMRESYKEAIQEEAKDLLAKFQDFYLWISDPSIEGYLPDINKKDGQRCKIEIIQALSELSNEIESKKKGEMITLDILVGKKKKALNIACCRHNDKTLPKEWLFQWSATYVGSPEHAICLTQTIAKKMIKSYSKPKNEFWLLVYNTDMPLDKGYKDFNYARDVLKKARHHFDKVWYFYPIANEDGGEVVKVWP